MNSGSKLCLRKSLLVIRLDVASSTMYSVAWPQYQWHRESSKSTSASICMTLRCTRTFLVLTGVLSVLACSDFFWSTSLEKNTGCSCRGCRSWGHEGSVVTTLLCPVSVILDRHGEGFVLIRFASTYNTKEIMSNMYHMYHIF